MNEATARPEPQVRPRTEVRRVPIPEAGLHILVLCYEYPPIGGGGGVGAQQYAEAWSAKGHRVTVITGGAPGLPERETRGDVGVWRVSALGKRERATSTGFSMLGYLASGLRLLLRERRALREVDVINTHFSLPTGPLGMAAARILSRPNVLTIIGGDVYDPSKRTSPHRNPALRSINRAIMKAADRLVAISSDTRTRARELYGVKRPIEVINYGFQPIPTEAEPSVSLPRTPRSFWLVAVGRLVRRKGFDHLLRAMAHLPAEVHLALIGDGPEDQELKELARAEGLEDRILWLGYQDRASVVAYMRAADCFVLSSLHEGLGIVVQEAMYAGLPIVSTSHGGQVDLIRHGHNGFLVEPGDPQALADGITRIMEEPDMALAMRRKNQDDIRHMYIESNCERYLRIFGELASRSRLRETTSH